MESLKQFFEWAATAIEVAAVILIIASITFGSLRFLIHINRHVGDAYKRYRAHLGKVLILSLEFLVAADIIRTIALDETLTNVAILGLLVLIRTFLSWSLSVEVEGHWPWAQGEDKITTEVPAQ